MQILKRYSSICPNHKEKIKLYFELIGDMRIIREGFYTSYCPNCNEDFKVIPDNKIS